MKKTKQARRSNATASNAQTLKLLKATAYEKGQADIQKRVHKLVKEFQKQLALILGQKTSAKKGSGRKTTVKRRGRPSQKA